MQLREQHLELLRVKGATQLEQVLVFEQAAHSLGHAVQVGEERKKPVLQAEQVSPAVHAEQAFGQHRSFTI